MSAREIIADAYRDMELNAISADDAVSAIMARLNAAGYRILAPGELDRETLERAAEVATNRFDLRHNARVRYAGMAIATAIRALPGKAGEA